MKIQKIGDPKIILSNPDSLHNYFGWPSVARLQDGRITVVCSGFRLAHVCPFGKAVIAYSEDEGETYTMPAPVIDTVLDDRDAGIVPFGEKNVIFTSFNNTVEFQRNYAPDVAYRIAYLDRISPEQEQAALGNTFKFSYDCGRTFGPLHHSPVTSPHGPVELQDGTLLWVGRSHQDGRQLIEKDEIAAYAIAEDGTATYRGSVEAIENENGKLLSCEPHAFQLPDGTILCHIRVQGGTGEEEVFTVYQTESTDGGYTWTKPHALLSRKGGSPAHLYRHSSGVLISSYGYRQMPYGIRLMFSRDDGKTWDTENILYETNTTPDLGYPATVELNDGSLLTVFYAHPDKSSPAVILQQKWRIEE